MDLPNYRIPREDVPRLSLALNSRNRSTPITFKAPANVPYPVVLTYPSNDGDAGQVLTTDGDGVLSWNTPAVTGPAGADTHVQYNDGGSFAGSSAFTFDAGANDNTLVLTLNAAQTANLVEFKSSGGSTRARVTDSARFSAQLMGPGTEFFGASAGAAGVTVLRSTGVGANALGTAVAGGDDNTAVGFDALAALTNGTTNTAVGSRAGDTLTNGGNNVVVGSASDVTSGSISSGVAVGADTVLASNDTVAVGYSAEARDTGGVAVGHQAHVTASGGVAVGRTATVTNTSSIALGDGALTTAANQLVCGSETAAISTIHFGKGAAVTSDVTAGAYIIKGTNAFASATSNRLGGTVSINGGDAATTGGSARRGNVAIDAGNVAITSRPSTDGTASGNVELQAQAGLVGGTIQLKAVGDSAAGKYGIVDMRTGGAPNDAVVLSLPHVDNNANITGITQVDGMIAYDDANGSVYARIGGTWTDLAGGGGGTPAGADTQIQYNDGGAFGASSAFTFATAGNINTLTLIPGSSQASNNLAEFEDGSSNTISVVTATGRYSAPIMGTGTEFFGSGAGTTGFTVDRCTGFGANVLNSITSSAGSDGDDNTAFGFNALTALTNATGNTGVGASALAAVTTGDFNTAVGSGSLDVLTTGGSNTCVGVNSGGALLSGSNNVIVGTNAALAATTIASSVVVGTSAGAALTSGLSNTLVGHTAGNSLTSGGSNVVIGVAAGTSMTNAASNTFVGQNAGNAVTSGTSNVAIGVNSDCAATSTSAVAIGNGASTSANYAVAIGDGVSAAGGVAIGRSSTTTANSQFVAGSTTQNITSVFFGSGATSASPADYIISGTANTTTNGDGGNVTVQGGDPDGAGDRGSVFINGTTINETGTHVFDTDVTAKTGTGVITAAEIMGGIVTYDGGGVGGDTLTFDAATNIVNAVPAAAVGHTIHLYVINEDMAASVDVEEGTGVTFSPTPGTLITVSSQASRHFLVRITNMGTPAVTVYNA